MTCSVYCLLRRPDQLDPLLDRLKDAGVRARDISVVLRDPPVVGLPIPAWWPLLWPLALYEWAASAQGGGGAGRIIPLARYRALVDARGDAALTSRL